MKRYCLCLLGFWVLPLFAAAPVVNVFTWVNYIPDKVIASFEKQTGIHVNLSSYESDEALYAKLKADPHIGYDVIIPTSYFVARMRREKMLRPLDHTQLPNWKNLDPLLLNHAFDPHNQYSYPYLWGSNGIAVDTRYWNPKTIQHWRDLWQPRFRNQLLLYDDARDVFAVAFLSMGKSINTTAHKTIKEAYQRLRQLMPNVRLFNTDAAISIYADNDVTVGMADSGDIVMARQDNPHLAFIYPKEGFPVWEDCFAIPRYAPHYRNALRFINFLMRPEISKISAMVTGFSSPNLKTRQLLPKKLRKDPIMYPSAQILKRGKMEGGVGKALPNYLHYWQLLKLL